MLPINPEDEKGLNVAMNRFVNNGRPNNTLVSVGGQLACDSESIEQELDVIDSSTPYISKPLENKSNVIRHIYYGLMPSKYIDSLGGRIAVDSNKIMVNNHEVIKNIAKFFNDTLPFQSAE